MNYIIGCGGVGSWLAEALVRLIPNKDRLVLVDGDTIERKNLDRQMFSEDQIGSNKAVALAEKLGCRRIPSWFSESAFPVTDGDWLFGCVDNNPARKSILNCCDMFGCYAIVASNETHSSEAWVYYPSWKGHPDKDPRINHAPGILSDHSGNPMAAAIGCTGEAQAQNRQLVTANFMAAALAAHLYVVWGIESRRMDSETRSFLPFRLTQNLTRNSFVSAVKTNSNQ